MIQKQNNSETSEYYFSGFLTMRTLCDVRNNIFYSIYVVSTAKIFMFFPYNMTPHQSLIEWETILWGTQKFCLVVQLGSGMV